MCLCFNLSTSSVFFLSSGKICLCFTGTGTLIWICIHLTGLYSILRETLLPNFLVHEYILFKTYFRQKKFPEETWLKNLVRSGSGRFKSRIQIRSKIVRTRNTDEQRLPNWSAATFFSSAKCAPCGRNCHY
jgi:hypothetical protein